jgi:putative nucleotidyltransferase with HDIG domain
MTTANIKEIIENMPDLPTMPNVVSEALNLIRDPKSNANQLADIISKDISLTSQILKLVNSAYYGFSFQIATISKAIALLGLTKVKNLVLSVAIKPMMVTQCSKILWEHSIRCAIGSETIAKSLGSIDPDEAFVMGLLHDIGKPVLEIYNKNATNEINRLVGLGADRRAAEKMMFGFDHTDVGAELVAKWNLPLIISTVVKYHHAPQESEISSVTGIVYVSDRITQDTLKYPVLDSDIIDAIGFELPEPLVLREEIFEKSAAIINALKK